eukprot:351486-Chlamydomonas_euryale.AAC.5
MVLPSGGGLEGGPPACGARNAAADGHAFVRTTSMHNGPIKPALPQAPSLDFTSAPCPLVILAPPPFPPLLFRRRCLSLAPANAMSAASWAPTSG